MGTGFHDLPKTKLSEDLLFNLLLHIKFRSFLLVSKTSFYLLSRQLQKESKLYIYNAVLVHKTVEIQGNEFRQHKNFTPPEFICPLNWDSCTSSVYLSAPIITQDWGGAYGATESLVMYNGAIYCHENAQV